MYYLYKIIIHKKKKKAIGDNANIAPMPDGAVNQSLIGVTTNEKQKMETI